MELRVNEVSVRLNQLERMPTITIHMRKTIGSPAIGEENHDLMDRLRICGEIVPKHVRIFEVGLRITRLPMNEEGEFGRITDEEDRSVVHNLFNSKHYSSA